MRWCGGRSRYGAPGRRDGEARALDGSVMLLSVAGTPVDQRYLFEARQMQALSLAVHIPLVCFGLAFPALVLFAEWRYLRTGNALFRTLAKRRTKVTLE